MSQLRVQIIMTSIKNAGSLTVVNLFRKGWKIMADDGQPIEGPALKTVVGMIKDMEFQVQPPLAKVNIQFWRSSLPPPKKSKMYIYNAIFMCLCPFPLINVS